MFLVGNVVRMAAIAPVGGSAVLPDRKPKIIFIVDLPYRIILHV
jgi:hypothetical protein